MDDTPAEFFRGMSSSDCLTTDGYLSEAAFRFDDYNSNERQDNYCELSINWNDDSGALDVLLNQHKPFKTEPQFKIGYCKFDKAMIQAVMKSYIDNKDFSYERKPISCDAKNDVSENKYHGNLLLNSNVDKRTKRAIQCTLATLGSNSFVKRNETDF